MKLISTITINNYTLLHTVTHWQLHLVDSCFRHLDSSIHHLMSVCTLVFYSRSLDPEVVWFRLTCFDIILCICKAGFQFSWAGFHCWGVENIPSALWKYLSWKNQKDSTKCSLQFGDSNCICLLTFLLAASGYLTYLNCLEFRFPSGPSFLFVCWTLILVSLVVIRLQFLLILLQSPARKSDNFHRC